MLQILSYMENGNIYDNYKSLRLFSELSNNK